ncbi:ATP binding protein [mine drainage metagenome]|uniref:ATP binding protein n=1 Tax=mine drainage metagenome TaxID=410659 RepID=T1C2E8_9ZZZZ
MHPDSAREPLVVSFSGGKDSVLALAALRLRHEVRITRLLTTVTREYHRIAMHGVREVLLDRQAEALGLPLDKIYLSAESGQEEYEDRIREQLFRYRAEGIQRVAFGDLFLEDIRAYRERQLAEVGMLGEFPLWGEDTRRLAEQFIDQGFRAIIVCVDTEQLAPDFAGRKFDRDFLSELPAGVDPAGERGEFHSFVYAGPLFSAPVAFIGGTRVRRRGRFEYYDLLPLPDPTDSPSG